MLTRAMIGASLLLVLLTAPCLAQDYALDEFDEIETIDMGPDDPVAFGFRSIGAGIGSLFRGRSYYYDERVVSVETTPAGAYLDLFYLRSNFQRRFEQAESPVRVLLPPRVETSADDLLSVRAFAEGYRMEVETLRADSTQTRVVIDLEPLPNTLELLSHQYFAGRSSLTFFTKEELTFRVQDAPEGISVILSETAKSAEAAASLETARSPIVDHMEGDQLGEDLLIQVTYSEQAIERQVEMRTRESYDAARDWHAFTIILTPREGRAEAVSKAQSALARLATKDVTGCASEFDKVLRSLLDPSALARALSPRGAFTDPYLRAAMQRLGEVSPDGVVLFAGGAAFKPAVPIELEAALGQASEAAGYLALLRQFVAEFEPEEFRRDTLRSLVAPELDLASFEKLVVEAETSERACRATL